MKLKWNTFNFNFSEGQIYVIWQNFASTSSFRDFKGMESKLVNTHNVTESKMMLFYLVYSVDVMSISEEFFSKRKPIYNTKKSVL